MNTKNKQIVYPSFSKYLAEKLKDKEFREAFEKEGQQLELSYKILQLRKKQKLSQEELAKKLNTTQSVVARIEAGKQNFTLETLQKIASAFKHELKIDFV